MTSRAGFSGLVTGLIATLVMYLWHAACSGLPEKSWLARYAAQIWIAAVGLAFLVLTGSFFAARWSGSARLWRRAVLGGLAGGLAGSIVYCFWGAAASHSLFPPPALLSSDQAARMAIIQAIIDATVKTFLALFFGGIILGAAGGLMAGSQRRHTVDVFDKEEPQMAMNAAITAVPASIVAVTLTAVIFTRLSAITDEGSAASMQTASIANLPLAVSLLILLLSHFALTLVVPHESDQSEHRCGMDEVKMAAYVGIAAAPVLVLVLYLIERRLFSNPLVIVAVVACGGLSLVCLYSLINRVLPKKASFPVPQDDRQRLEASLFGSIARSRGSRLVMLCIGCGLVMVLPLCISVLSVLVNLTPVLDNSAFAFIAPGPWRLFKIQALVNGGSMAAAILLLTAIYLFYLNLGRWFSKWNASRLK